MDRGTPLDYMGPEEAEAYTAEMARLMEEYVPLIEKAKGR